MLLRSFGSRGPKVGAPQEPPQGPSSSGARIGAPEEHPRGGSCQEQPSPTTRWVSISQNLMREVIRTVN